MTFEENIAKNKKRYPFERWYENGIEFEMDQYSRVNCTRAEKVMDNLIDQLIEAGPNSSPEKRLMLIADAVKAFNELNTEIEGFIETGEREDLCDLFDSIAISVGLNPADYNDDIAYQWREW